MRAGELRGAFGISSRFNESIFEPDALFLATVPASGDTTVDEVYGEVLVPVVGEFELEFGARYSDFTTGDFQLDAKSYKALFSWGATESMRFRGGWQRANRTPNVAELYSGPTGQVYTWAAGDACRADTTHPWGNLASNPTRAQMQQLCAELIYKEGGIPGQTRFDAGRDNFPIDGGESANVYRLLTTGNPELRAEIRRYVHARHDLAARRARRVLDGGSLSDRDRGRRRQPRVSNGLSAVLQRQRREQSDLLRRQRVLPGDSSRSHHQQRRLRRGRQLQLEQALHAGLGRQPELAQGHGRRRVRDQQLDQQAVLVAAARVGGPRFADARVRRHGRRRQLVLRLPAVHAVLIQPQQPLARVELALFAAGDARLEGADPDADGRGYRGVPSVQRERLVAVQRAHSVARRYRQHRRRATADRRRESVQREQPDQRHG